MIIETLSTAVGLVGIVIGLVVGAYEWWGMPRVRRRVIVNFRDPQAPAIDGLLWQRRGRWMVLRDCVLLEPSKHVPTKLDGEILIDREQTLFVQVFYEPPRRG